MDTPNKSTLSFFNGLNGFLDRCKAAQGLISKLFLYSLALVLLYKKYCFVTM
jgi:hypothetical protein